ncbi:MAG: hypothetical protein RQ990_07980, partial [Candidatus Hydrothermia bacterium]|nr:hypothetical protein [Candidatus Hydrothermia bacterium]
LFSRGDDGLVRFWIYYENWFYFLKEIGEYGFGYGHYEKLGDYLFYTVGNKLIVYNIKSEAKINEREFPSEILSLEANNDVVYVYYGKIKQGVKIFDNEIVYDLADIYDKLPSIKTRIDLDEGFIIVHEGQIIYAFENNKAFSKVWEYEIPTENSITLIKNFILMKDSIHYLYDFEKNSVILSLSDELAFSNNDNFLITFDKANNLKMYDLNDYKLRKSVKMNDNVYSIAFNDNYLFLGSDGYILIYKLKERIAFKEFETIKKLKKIEVSKEKIEILKVFENYLFAYSNGVLKVFTLEKFEEIYSIKANLKDFFYNDLLFLIFEDKIDICKLNGQVQKTVELKPTSYLLNGKKVLFGTKDGKVVILENDEIREYSVSNSEIKFISKYKNYYLLCDKFGVYLFIDVWEIKQILSYNPSKPITGIKKFDDYLSIAYLNGQIKTYHRDGSLKSVMKTKGFEDKEIVIDNGIKFLAFDDGYIILKGNKVYGSKNWRDYVYFVDGYDIIMSDNYYDFYEEPSLFDELNSL